MSNLRNMEYLRFDQSITFFYNYFESGPVDQMLCKEFYFSSGGSLFCSLQSRTGWAICQRAL